MLITLYSCHSVYLLLAAIFPQLKYKFWTSVSFLNVHLWYLYFYLLIWTLTLQATGNICAALVVSPFVILTTCYLIVQARFCCAIFDNVPNSDTSSWVMHHVLLLTCCFCIFGSTYNPAQSGSNWILLSVWHFILKHCRRTCESPVLIFTSRVTHFFLPAFISQL